MAAPEQIGIGFEEDRVKDKGPPSTSAKLSGYCLTSGYTGAPILFHPRRQSGCNFRYLGRQSSEPRAHVIAFAQKPEFGEAVSAFRTGLLKTNPLLQQGLIWVDPMTFQIVRLRMDLLAPMPEISLQVHTTEITFSEVHFNPTLPAFWLPHNVMVSILWKGKAYRNSHRYSNYRLFTVKVRIR
jgi:hypothetical protein